MTWASNAWPRRGLVWDAHKKRDGHTADGRAGGASRDIGRKKGNERDRGEKIF